MESFISRVLSRRRASRARGFTLVEMLVVLAIIAVITSIALFGQGDFNRSVLLTDTTYSVALSTRQMQSYGVSSRRFNGIQNPGYGAYFSMAAPTSYITFADTYRPTGSTPPSNCNIGTPNTPEAKPGDCIYTAGQDGIVQTYSFSRNFVIGDVCGKDAGVRRCASDATNPLSAISVTFLRSSPESMIEGLKGGVWVPLTSAEIFIKSDTASRIVCVSQVGQISVSYAAQCP